MDLYYYSKSLSADVKKTKKSNFKILEDYFYTDEYGLMFDNIEFEMYGEGFKLKQPEMAKMLDDKQASGYLNLEQLLQFSAENGFIP